MIPKRRRWLLFLALATTIAGCLIIEVAVILLLTPAPTESLHVLVFAGIGLIAVGSAGLLVHKRAIRRTSS